MFVFMDQTYIAPERRQHVEKKKMRNGSAWWFSFLLSVTGTWYCVYMPGICYWVLYLVDFILRLILCKNVIFLFDYDDMTGRQTTPNRWECQLRCSRYLAQRWKKMRVYSEQKSSLRPKWRAVATYSSFAYFASCITCFLHIIGPSRGCTSYTHLVFGCCTCYTLSWRAYYMWADNCLIIDAVRGTRHHLRTSYFWARLGFLREEGRVLYRFQCKSLFCYNSC